MVEGSTFTNAARPDAARPDAARPDGARPDGARPDATRPDVTRPNASGPDVIGLDTPRGLAATTRCRSAAPAPDPVPALAAPLAVSAAEGGMFWSGAGAAALSAPGPASAPLLVLAASAVEGNTFRSGASTAAWRRSAASAAEDRRAWFELAGVTAGSMFCSASEPRVEASRKELVVRSVSHHSLRSSVCLSPELRAASATLPSCCPRSPSSPSGTRSLLPSAMRPSPRGLRVLPV